MGNIDSQAVNENIIFNVVYLNLRENGTGNQEWTI